MAVRHLNFNQCAIAETLTLTAMKKIKFVLLILLFFGFTIHQNKDQSVSLSLNQKVLAVEEEPKGDGDCFWCLGYQPDTVVEIICWQGIQLCIPTSCRNGCCLCEV